MLSKYSLRHSSSLAAVVMHTAQHLVHKCLTGDLACGRTIIIVTRHVTTCLPAASYLLEIDKGTVLHQGTIPELEERGLLVKVLEAEERPFSDPPPWRLTSCQTALMQPQKRQLSDGKLIEVEARAEGQVSIRSYVIELLVFSHGSSQLYSCWLFGQST
jgi:hypothetical protein